MAFNNSTASFSAYDGRIRCLPREKNGPYVCPICLSAFNSPQKYSSHVRIHYKNETEAERTQRELAKEAGKRGIQLAKIKQRVITVVPRDYSGEFVSAYADATPRPPVKIKIERVEIAEGVFQSKYAVAPPPGMQLIPDAGVMIKVEVKQEY